jgi:hypothetical protein
MPDEHRYPRPTAEAAGPSSCFASASISVPARRTLGDFLISGASEMGQEVLIPFNGLKNANASFFGEPFRLALTNLQDLYEALDRLSGLER